MSDSDKENEKVDAVANVLGEPFSANFLKTHLRSEETFFKFIGFSFVAPREVD